MSTVVALILWFAVACYAVFGGADYGAGFWDLTAGGARRGAPARALIDHAMAPVWEANNVWLIFALVVLWTAFPPRIRGDHVDALRAAGPGRGRDRAARLPGSCFGSPTKALAGRRLFGATFALSSVVTPFFLGAVFGAIASGRVRAGDTIVDPMVGSPAGGARRRSWSVCWRSRARLFWRLFFWSSTRAGWTRRWTVPSGGGRSEAVSSTGLVAIVGLFVIRSDAPFLFHGLVHDGLPFVLLSGACGGAVVVLLTQGITRGTRALAVLAVVSVLAGWGVAQYPYLLPTSLTLEARGGRDPLALLAGGRVPRRLLHRGAGAVAAVRPRSTQQAAARRGGRGGAGREPPPGGGRGRRFRRALRDAGARLVAGRRHPRRPRAASSLPAAAVPGRDRHSFRRGDRPLPEAHPALPRECRRAAGRGHRLQSPAPGGCRPDARTASPSPSPTTA